MANALSGMSYLNQDYGTEENPASAPKVEGGWGGALVAGVSALAGLATDNPYLVGFGSDMASSYAESYDTLNKSLMEEQRANRLANAALDREKHLAQYEYNMRAGERESAERWKQREYDFSREKFDAEREDAREQAEREKRRIELEERRLEETARYRNAQLYWSSPEGQIEAKKMLDEYEDNEFEERMASLEAMGEHQLAADMRGARNAGMSYDAFQQSTEERRQKLRDEGIRAEIREAEMLDAAAYKRAEQAGASPELLSNIALSQATGIPILEVPLATKEGRAAQQEELLGYELRKMEAVQEKTQELSDLDFARKMEELRANPNINSNFVELMEISRVTGIAPEKLLSTTGTKGKSSSGSGGGISFTGSDIRQMKEYYAGIIMDNVDGADIDSADALADKKVQEMIDTYGGKTGETLLSMITTSPDAGEERAELIGRLTDRAMQYLTSRVKTPEELEASVANDSPEEKIAVQNAIQQFRISRGETGTPANPYTQIGALRGAGDQTRSAPVSTPEAASTPETSSPYAAPPGVSDRGQVFSRQIIEASEAIPDEEKKARIEARQGRARGSFVRSRPY